MSILRNMIPALRDKDDHNELDAHVIKHVGRYRRPQKHKRIVYQDQITRWDRIQRRQRKVTQRKMQRRYQRNQWQLRFDQDTRIAQMKLIESIDPKHAAMRANVIRALEKKMTPIELADWRRSESESRRDNQDKAVNDQ